jgi:hypothetical protein
MVSNEVQLWLSVNDSALSYQLGDSGPSQMDV